MTHPVTRCTGGGGRTGRSIASCGRLSADLLRVVVVVGAGLESLDAFLTGCARGVRGLMLMGE